jgi:hypothetical protein
MTHFQSANGRLRVSWDIESLPLDVARASVTVVLRKLGSDDVEALMQGAFKNDCLRIPVVVGDGSECVYAPADRALTLFLCLYNRKGQFLASPEIEVRDEAEITATPEVVHVHTERHPDFVFVEGGKTPDMRKLAQNVARSLSGEGAGASRSHHVGSFGTKQRWYLSRIGWNRSTQDLVIVARPTFISMEDLALWEQAPPDEAVALPAGCDGLIDATSPEGTVTFYAVLEGPAPWRPLRLAPVPPPFDTVHAPFVLGDANGRLGDSFRSIRTRVDSQPLALKDLPSLLALWEAAISAIGKCDTQTEVLRWIEDCRKNALF